MFTPYRMAFTAAPKTIPDRASVHTTAVRGGGGSHPVPETRGGGVLTEKLFLALWSSVWSEK